MSVCILRGPGAEQSVIDRAVASLRSRGVEAWEADRDGPAKAITDRPRTIAPWWLWPAEVATVVLRAPVERATQVWWRRRAKHSD